MPPLEHVGPPEGDVVPYPNDILVLGDNRWLTVTGKVITAPFGDPVDLKENTRAFWEGAAARAGCSVDSLRRPG